MSDNAKRIILKYAKEMYDKSIRTSPVDACIDFKIAIEFLAQAIEEYEQMNSTPRVDFWGQPI